MTENHPITPPSELVQQWDNEAVVVKTPEQVYIATQAARWGSDMELEACCEWMRGSLTPFMPDQAADQLRAARRPKPPSLAKQGCDALDTYIYGNTDHKDKERTYNTIRAALDRLKELEQSND